MARIKIYLNLARAHGIDYPEVFSEEFDLEGDAKRIILRGSKREKEDLENTYVDMFAKKRFGRVKRTNDKGETKEVSTYLGVWFDKRPNEFKDNVKITDFDLLRRDMLEQQEERFVPELDAQKEIVSSIEAQFPGFTPVKFSPKTGEEISTEELVKIKERKIRGAIWLVNI